MKYRGKDFNFQYCELTEKEEPNLKALPKTATEQEQQDWATETGTERILAMIEKANKKQPAKATIMKENWGMLPTSLRYKISNHIMGVESSDSENFTL